MKYDFTTLLDRSNTGSAKWDGMKARKPDVSGDAVPFTTADMEFINAPEIREAIKEYVDNNILGYTSPTKKYYESVCGWMKRIHGVEVAPEEIVVYPGVVPALFHLVRALCHEGDGVIVMPPIYPPFYGAANAFGCQQVLCPLINEDERYTIDFALLEKLCREETNKLLIFCSPHNPAGRVWTQEEIREVARICSENGVTIISDEIHSDIIMPGYTHVSMGTLTEYADHIVLCTAPSKTFNLASMQTSNIIVKNSELREKLLKTKQEMVVESLNVLGFVACAAAYDKCEGWMREMIEVVHENYRYLRDFLAENLPQLKLAPMEGTYLAWMDCRGLHMEREKLEQFFVDHELFFNGGLMFGEQYGEYMRIVLAAPTFVIKKMCEKLLAAVQEL